MGKQMLELAAVFIKYGKCGIRIRVCDETRTSYIITQALIIVFANR